MTEFNRNYDLHHPSYNQARPYLWLYSTVDMTEANPTYGQTQPSFGMFELYPSYDRT